MLVRMFHRAFGVLLLLLAACGGEVPLAPVAVPDAHARLNVTESEMQAFVDAWRADGSPTPASPVVTLQTTFSSGYTQFNGVGSVAFNLYSNDNEAKLSLKLIDENGGTINDDTWEAGNVNGFPLGTFARFAPLSGFISTAFNNCGLVGKGKITGHSRLVSPSPSGYVTLWGDPISKNAPDLMMPKCPEQTECNGYVVEDPSTCSDSEGGSSNYGGGGGGGGSTGECELWSFTLRRSFDNGVTWYIVSRWYEYIC
jgi:hypothetical protein